MFMSKEAMNGKRVLIAGAGLAGCSAAISAFDEGHEIVVIESKKRESIVNGSTSFEAFQNLTSRGDAIDHLEGFGIHVKPEYPYNGARIIGPEGNDVDFRMKRSHGYFIRRGGKGSLDEHMIKILESRGMDIRFETRLKRADPGGNVTYQGPEGSISKKFDSIIGADGLGTTVGKGIVKPLSREDVAVGIGYQFKGDHGFEPGIAECYLGSRLCPGEYAYVLPTEDEITIVTTMRPHLMKNGASPEDYLERFVTLPSIEERIGNARIINRISGGVPVTSGGPLGGGKILLAGEAARLTDPILGFGMVNAIISGVMAGGSVGSDDPLGIYELSIEDAIIKDLRSRIRVRKDLVDRANDRTLDRIINAADILMGRVECDDLFEGKTRNKAILSSIPDLIRTGGFQVAVRFLIPFARSNYSMSTSII